LLKQHSSGYPAQLYLFDESGEQLAGTPIALPDRIAGELHRGPFGREGGAPPPLKPMNERPLLLMRTDTPPAYWIDARIPVWTPGARRPAHGVLVWKFDSLWLNPFFFDYRAWFTVVLAIVLVSLICWVPLIRGLTRSISQLTRATGRIAEGHFEIELPAKRRDELGRLSASINSMAARLSGFVHGQRRFLSDIAHELSSPIARIQTALAILEQRATDTQRDYVADVQEEVAHMSGLINELLLFSKAQISGPGKELKPVNVAETVRRVLEREASDGAYIEVRVSEELEATANPDYLFRSLANLVRNAIRYAGNAGPIVISGKNGGGEVAITVADSGPGLPEAELDQVFKPFYRPEFARQRETGGVGLGLAIVRSCIEACGGKVICRNRKPTGLEVEIQLPVSADS
jgi:two-component system sensor histidine kinase CpxA